MYLDAYIQILVSIATKFKHSVLLGVKLHDTCQIAGVSMGLHRHTHTHSYTGNNTHILCFADRASL
jgi:hypothetical protein